jgi:hypothetical protein
MMNTGMDLAALQPSLCTQVTESKVTDCQTFMVNYFVIRYDKTQNP